MFADWGAKLWFILILILLLIKFWQSSILGKGRVLASEV